MVVLGEGPQTSECTRPKGALEMESPLLKGKAWNFASWQGWQATLLISTCPRTPLETKDYNLEKETWPKQECHNSGVTKAAQWVIAWDGTFKETSSNRRSTLLPVPIICPVWGSYTTHPWSEKYTPKPSSHNWLTDKRFKVSWGTKNVSETDKCALDISPVWLTCSTELSACLLYTSPSPRD